MFCVTGRNIVWVYCESKFNYLVTNLQLVLIRYYWSILQTKEDRLACFLRLGLCKCQTPKNSSMLNNSLIRWLTNITCLLFWSSKNWIVRLWSADCFIPHLPVKRGFSVNPGDFCMATVKPSRSLPKISVNETNGEGIEVLPSAFLTPKCARNLRTTLQKHRSLFWP